MECLGYRARCSSLPPLATGAQPSRIELSFAFSRRPQYYLYKTLLPQYIMRWMYSRVVRCALSARVSTRVLPSFHHPLSFLSFTVFAFPTDDLANLSAVIVSTPVPSIPPGSSTRILPSFHHPTDDRDVFLGRTVSRGNRSHSCPSYSPLIPFSLASSFLSTMEFVIASELPKLGRLTQVGRLARRTRGLS